MDADRRARRDRILEEALTLAPADLAVFLDAMCEGDADLRRELDDILSRDPSQDGNVLDGPPDLWPFPFEPGRRIGRYTIDAVIGEGGMGIVYRAKDEQIDRFVALKMLTASAGSEAANRRFLTELRALGRFRHEGVVRVYDFGAHHGTPFIVTELLEGEDLSKAIKGGRCGDLLDKLRLAKEIALTMRDIHAAGIVHRDLKPANVFLDAAVGRVKLLDFGIARTEDRALTRSIAAGTPAYMSPEQFRNEGVTALSDIYSYGVILYELFTGARLYTGDLAAVAYRVVHEPVSSGPLEAVCPPTMVELIRSAMAKNPLDRLQSFDRIAETLTDLIGDAAAQKDGVTAADAGAPEAPARPRAGRSWRAMGLTLLVTVSLVAAIGAVRWLRSSSAPPASPVAPAPSPLRQVGLAFVMENGGQAVAASRLPIVFGGRDRFRLQLTSPEAGFVYVFAESLDTHRMTVLFPSPTTKGGSSVIEPERPVLIPEASWLYFGPRAGDEKLWIVWSRDRQAVLEGAQRWANERDRGEIKDAGEAARIRILLTATPDRLLFSSGRLELSGAEDVLVGAVPVRHQ